MTLYTPRTAAQIQRDLLAKIIARTDVSDINVGSSLFTILNAVSIEIANVESRLSNIKKGYSFDTASGADLDVRVSELPPTGISRKNKTNAAGSVLTIKRATDNVLNELIIPAGSTVQRSDNGLTYLIPQTIVMEPGISELNEVYIVCTTPGTVGNVYEGNITVAANMPADIIEVNNTIAIGNGIDSESDASLRQRALRYINSLGRCSKSALEFLGTSFISTDNTSFKFASIYEDPERNGYAELIVDDGTGLVSPPTRSISEQSFNITTSGSRIISVQRPAILEFTNNDISVIRDGAEIQLLNDDFIHIPERGTIFFKQGVLLEGDQVKVYPFRIYTGNIAQLQTEIEGNVNSPSILTGFRAAGTRVRVQPPKITDYSVDVRIIARPGTNIEQTKIQITNAIIDYVNNIDIGKELNPSSLITHLMITQNIAACNLFISGTNTPKNSEYPASPKHALRTKKDLISVSTTF